MSRFTLLLCALFMSNSAVAQVSPWIVAHRGGGADAPENTLLAIRRSLHNGTDALWLSVQLSADGVPVLYRPQDLSALTPRHGPVAKLTARELAGVNAGWSFRVRTGTVDVFPYRHRPRGVGIPTLQSALRLIPSSVPIFLDLKALPAQPLVDAVAGVLEREHAWQRVLLYSTDASVDAAWKSYPRAQRLESRNATRSRLLTLALAHRCEEAPTAAVWTAFEVRRPLEITETFTLGQGHSAVGEAMLWTPQAMECFRSADAQVRILWIAVNSEDDYRAAIEHGADAVLVDSPHAAVQWRNR